MNWYRIVRWQAFAVAFVVVAVVGQTNMLPNGGFESGQPSLWTAEGGGANATLTWATDQVEVGTHSLKIEKTGTGTMARWISDNNVRYWVDRIYQGVDIKLGAWVKTQGVNINPASDAERWQVKFWFYDSLGGLIGGVPFVLNVDQSTATRDWYADTNGVGAVILPQDAFQMKMSAEGGTNATGTVWFDNFIFVARSGWAGQNWNGFADADSGWQYWIAPNGGNDGQSYFPASGVTTDQARTGSYSLKIAGADGRQQGELIFFTETVPIPAGSAGKKYVLSAWVKTSGIKKDSVFNPEYTLGFTWTWHDQMFTDGQGWHEIASGDYRFVLKDTAADWTQYQVILTVPDNAVQAISVRPRAWHLWTGVSYWDDFSLNAVLNAVASVDDDPAHVSAFPTEYRLLQNYPNPFNPSTVIEYALPHADPVRLEVFNVLGQKIRTLVNGVQAPGTWRIEWNGKDDIGASVSSGIYLYRLETPSVVLTRKMIMIK